MILVASRGLFSQELASGEASIAASVRWDQSQKLGDICLRFSNQKEGHLGSPYYVQHTACIQHAYSMHTAVFTDMTDTVVSFLS